jgi:hypothetical protein
MRMITKFESYKGDDEENLRKLSNGLLNFLKQFNFLKDKLVLDVDYNIYIVERDSYYLFLRVYKNKLYKEEFEIACIVDQFRDFGAYFNHNPILKYLKKFLKHIYPEPYLKLTDVDKFLKQLTLENFQFYNDSEKYNL